MKQLLFTMIGLTLWVGFNACQQSQENTVQPQKVTNSSAFVNGATATVVASNWQTVPLWAATNNTAGYSLYRYTFTGVAALTKDIIDNGAILVYSRPDGAVGQVFQVPFQRAWAFQGTNMIQERWNYEATQNQLMIVIDPSTNGYPAPPATTQIRWVFIPATATGRKANIDYNNYEEVKAAFGLED